MQPVAQCQCQCSGKSSFDNGGGVRALVLHSFNRTGCEVPYSFAPLLVLALLQEIRASVAMPGDLQWAAICFSPTSSSRVSLQAQ